MRPPFQPEPGGPWHGRRGQQHVYLCHLYAHIFVLADALPVPFAGEERGQPRGHSSRYSSGLKKKKKMPFGGREAVKSSGSQGTPAPTFLNISHQGTKSPGAFTIVHYCPSL